MKHPCRHHLVSLHRPQFVLHKFFTSIIANNPLSAGIFIQVGNKVEKMNSGKKVDVGDSAIVLSCYKSTVL